MRRLDRILFKNDEQYGRYIKTWELNNDSNSYSGAVMELINIFIENDNASNEIVKKHPQYNQLSGAQVEMAQGYYKEHYDKIR